MEKFVVIGTGFIGGYMINGMRKVSKTDNLKNIAFGIKGHAKDVEKRSKELGFDVSVNNTAEILERENPTVIIFSPPPEVAPDIVTNILKPYYEKCKKSNINLPDLYSFIPSPSADWIYEKLGDGVNVVKILPNIIDEVCGYNLSPIGINYISYAKHQWSENRKNILLECMSAYGYTVETNDKDSLVLLSGKITSHICYEISFTISEVCQHLGYDISINTIGSAMRKAQYNIFEDIPKIGSFSDKKIPDSLEKFLNSFMNSWFNGLNKFTMENKDIVTDNDAKYIDMCSFALNVFPIRYKTKSELIQDTKNAATKGGILERGIEYFYEHIESELKKEVANILSNKEQSLDFFKWVETMSYNTSSEAYKRSLFLQNKK